MKDWLIDRLIVIDWLIDWLIVWLIDWLIDWQLIQDKLGENEKLIKEVSLSWQEKESLTNQIQVINGATLKVNRSKSQPTKVQTVTC